MKLKLVILFISLFTLQGIVKADEGKLISKEQLPTKALQFIKNFFVAEQISYAKEEEGFFNKEYDVIFTTGNKIEFNKRGEWLKVECQKEAVPAGIVPEKINAQIKQHHPNLQIIKIEFDSKDYEVKLNNGLELKFNKKMQLIGFDD